MLRMLDAIKEDTAWGTVTGGGEAKTVRIEAGTVGGVTDSESAAAVPNTTTSVPQTQSSQTESGNSESSKPNTTKPVTKLIPKTNFMQYPMTESVFVKCADAIWQTGDSDTSAEKAILTQILFHVLAGNFGYYGYLSTKPIACVLDPESESRTAQDLAEIVSASAAVCMEYGKSLTQTSSTTTRASISNSTTAPQQAAAAATGSKNLGSSSTNIVRQLPMAVIDNLCTYENPVEIRLRAEAATRKV